MKLLQKIPTVLWFSVIVIALMASDCTLGTPDPEPIPQTRVLEIKLTPDTVAVGDTVLIHCVIEDSLDSRFKFYWNLGEERTIPVNGSFTGPRIKWWAKGFEHLDSGEVQTPIRGVRVDNGSQDSITDYKSFEIPVINPN